MKQKTDLQLWYFHERIVYSKWSTMMLDLDKEEE
jgi:hypothetical protein